MKSISTIAILGLLLTPAIYGCAPQPQVSHEVIPVKQKQILEVTIIEGKTSKQEIIEALGTPDKISNGSITYRKKKDTVYRVHLTQKDGTQFNIEISDEKNGKMSMLIFLDYKKSYGIVDYVHI